MEAMSSDQLSLPLPSSADLEMTDGDGNTKSVAIGREAAEGTHLRWWAKWRTVDRVRDLA